MPVMQDAELKYSFYLGKFPEHSLDHTFDWNCVNAALNYLDERSSTYQGLYGSDGQLEVYHAPV